jgi:hypothetical protein
MCGQLHVTALEIVEDWVVLEVCGCGDKEENSYPIRDQTKLV